MNFVFEQHHKTIFNLQKMIFGLTIKKKTDATYEILTSEDGPLELTSHEGLIMPNIKMVADERFAHINPDCGVCPFLNAQGRCVYNTMGSKRSLISGSEFSV